MRTRLAVASLVGLLVVALATPAPSQGIQLPIKPPKGLPSLKGLPDIGLLYTLSGPHTEANLSIHLVHGKDTIAAKQVLTLSEALARKLVIVHETKAQNQLLIENLSSEVEIYIQAGDIVKGGHQDRVLGSDLLVSAKSRWTIPAFCVEKGRWQQRGVENSMRFEASTDIVVGKSLRLAVSSSRNQNFVWQSVADAQRQLSLKLGVSAQSRVSPTSLQLTLETPGLQAKLERYLAALTKVIDSEKDVIGCIVCINGKIVGAELYGSSELFRKLWPKLLRSAAIEAVADFDAAKQFPPVSRLAARAFLAEARLTNQAEVREMAKRLHLASLDTAKYFLMETRDQQAKGAMVHMSVIVK
jgi:hypothetical protein